MMKGYDKQEALAFICNRIHKKEHPELVDRLESLISQTIDADMRFMHETGVLDEEGNAGDSYYEDDEAIEYMVDVIAENNDLTPDEAVKVAALVDEYMDLQQTYLESKGLMDWE